MIDIKAYYIDEHDYTINIVSREYDQNYGWMFHAEIYNGKEICEDTHILTSYESYEGSIVGCIAQIEDYFKTINSRETTIKNQQEYLAKKRSQSI